MIEHLTSILFLLIVIAPIAVFARQVQQVRRGAQGRVKATLLFMMYAICPVLAYALSFSALVAVEELTELSTVNEGISRTLVVIVGFGLGEALLLTGIFAITARLLNVVRGGR